jgi:3-oxoacid CoA-transferase B subunit/3-oxoacid CoA-transferase A subunit
MTGRVAICDSALEAVAGIADGATVLVGGFGSAGQPVELVEALLEGGASELTIVSNNAGGGDHGLAALIRDGRVRKVICSYPRQSDSWHFDAAYRAGAIELELVPQGTLAERIRAAGAGIGAFFTPTGFGTPLGEGKETRMIDGRGYLLEYPQDRAQLRADHSGRRGQNDRAGGRDRAGRRARSRACRHAVPVRRPRHARRPQPGCVGRQTMSTLTGIDRDALARVVAADIPPGSFVNLGIGLPTRISNHLPPDSGVMLHTENGMLGMGREARGEAIDPDLVNAGKVQVTELPGASYFHHADSFAMMRGGHLDICVLGAYQVSAAGDLANWHTGQPGDIPAVGGAMDLAIGARQTFVMMTLLTRDGRPKLVPECTHPLTGLACVSRVYTDLAVFLIEPGRVVVRDLFGTDFGTLATLVRVPLVDGTLRAAL